METKWRITGMQMGVLMYLATTGTAFLLMPSAAMLLAGNDMWITPLLASTAGFIPVWATGRLHRLYPGENLFGAMNKALGTACGRIVGLLFVLFQFHIFGASTRDYSEFVSGNFFERTPMVVLIGTMIFVCGLAVRAGVESMARCAIIFLPVVLTLLLLNCFLLLPEMDAKQMLPFFADGPVPVVKATAVVQGWFCQYVMISFLYPYANTKKPARIGHLSVAIAALSMLLVNSSVLFLFGLEAKKFYYPFLMASRYIRVADFIEHVEAMVMMSWVLGTFVRLSLFYHAATVGVAHVLGVKDYRVMAWPTGLLLVISGIWVAPSMPALTAFIGTWGTVYILSGFVVFPVLLLAVAELREKGRRSGANTRNESV